MSNEKKSEYRENIKDMDNLYKSHITPLLGKEVTLEELAKTIEHLSPW
jgi:hypothetical protein